MAHPLQQKIGVIRRRARALLIGYGVSALIAVLTATIVTFGCCDWLLHFEDVGVRIICSILVLGAALWGGYYFLWPAVRTSFTDVELAQRVERRYPKLADRLASSMQFLRQSEHDAQAGSPALRRVVIMQTTDEVAELDLKKVFDVQPTKRAAMVAFGTCGMAALLALLNPQAAGIALARLANPLGETAWPKATHLAFVNEPPTRLALGQTFEVEVKDSDGARLPDEVKIHYRHVGEGQSGADTSEAMRFAGGLMVARKESISRPFEYRVTGGDDNSMPWRRLEVVEPPAIEGLTVMLHYPEYTGWPREKSDPHLRTLHGTRVEIAARTTKPLRSATIHMDDGTSIGLELTDNGYAIGLAAGQSGDSNSKSPAENPQSEIPNPQSFFTVTRSGSYWFDLEDAEGFHGGQDTRYEIRAIEDKPPTVNLDEPPANIFVTAKAVVPLKISAKDDVALRQIALSHLRTDKSGDGEAALVLFEGPAKREAHSSTMDASGDSRTVEPRWDLGPLDLKPGTQVTIYATATDYQPLVGQSHPRRLTIITPEELQDRLAQRQTAILGELARLLKLERESRSHVSELQIQIEKVGQFSKQDIDHLQGAELSQRQVDRGLTSPTEGVTTQVLGLLADLDNNKVDSPDIQRRMQGLLGEINRLGKEHLPVVARELTNALKASQSSDGRAGPKPENPPSADPGDEKTVSQSLKSAGENQDQVIQSLESMLGELSQWDNYRRFHREIGQLRRDQEEVGTDTAKLGPQTLAKEFKDLTPQQQADLKKLASRQTELARRFDKIQQRMEQMSGELKETDPLAADTLSDALHRARQTAVGGKMREAGRHAEQNQLGQAGQQQQEASKDLGEMLDILSNRKERELAGLVKKLREAEQQLQQLRRDQEGLKKKLQDAAKNPNEMERKRELERLSRQQRELQEQTERFARTLKRLQADQAARTAARGGSKMGQAGEQGEKGEGEEAAEQAAQAQKDLDDAQQQLSQQRKKAETDLAREQLARLADSLKSLHGRQGKLVEETKHYEQLRQAQDAKFTRPQSLSVRDLGRQQAALETETQDLAKKLAAAAAFELALKGAAREMTVAAGLLDQRETGETTQQAERNAMKRYEQIMEALSEKGDKPEGQQDQGGRGGQGGQQGGGGGDGIRSISELKLLKLMQDEINARTQSLEEARIKAKNLSPAQQEEYLALSKEQGDLADLLLEMTKPEAAPENDPEKLPDLDPKKKASEQDPLEPLEAK